MSLTDVTFVTIDPVPTLAAAYWGVANVFACRRRRLEAVRSRARVGHRAGGRRPHHRGGRVRLAGRTQRGWQVNLAAPGRRPRSPRPRRRAPRRSRLGTLLGARPGPHAPPAHRLRVPVLPPAAEPDC